MKRLLVCLTLVIAVCRTASALEWLTDLPTALSRAKSENKVVLLDFTGSDWCGWCKKLRAEVFDQYDFAGYANANLIMVEVDFPHYKQLSAEQTAANESLAAKYGIQGFPTIILLNANGDQIGKSGYRPGGPSAYIADLSRIPGMPNHGGYAPPPPVASANANDSTPEPPRKPAEFVPVAPTSPTKYGDLALKAISGVGNNRMVLINNETLMTGESAKIKTHDTKVEVTVKEIRDNSVLIVANGQIQELKMAHY